MAQLVFVGTRRHRLHGNGKMSPDIALPAFRAAGADWGVEVHAHENLDALAAAAARHAGAIVVLLYNEESIQAPDYAQEVQQMDALARHGLAARHIVHAPEHGLVIGNKRQSHLAFQRHGVPVPRELREGDGPAFSVAVLGSGEPVQLVSGAALDPRRHNTRFIDTVRSFRGRSYHVCLRAMAVGGTLIATYVRARDVAEGSASVHAVNTPKDADLLNWLYATVVLPRQGELERICRSVERAFGLGFYSHDILPEAATGKLFVCETGFKVDEISLRAHLARIGPSLAWPALWNGGDMAATAHAFFHACRERELI